MKFIHQHAYTLGLGTALLMSLGWTLVPASTQDPLIPAAGDDIAKLRAEVKSLRTALEADVRNGERVRQLANDLSRFNPPIGSIMPFAGKWPPLKPGGGRYTETEIGWMLLDDRPIDGDDYQQLRRALQSDTLPDCAGRTLVVAGEGAGLTHREAGTTGGEETHTMTVREMPRHGHKVLNPGHTTDTKFPGNPGGIYDSGNKRQAASHFNPSNRTLNVQGFSLDKAGRGRAFNVMQPYSVLHYIIKFSHVTIK